MTNKEKGALAEWVVEYTLKQGADGAKVNISNGREIEIDYRDEKLDNLKESTSNSLWLDIYANKRYSGHSTSDFRKDELKKFIDGAVEATKYLSEDEFRTLPDRKYYPKDTRINLKIEDDNYSGLNSEKRKKTAKEIEDVVLAQSDKIISAECGYRDGYYESVLANSNGFRGERVSTVFSAGASVTVKDGEKGRPSDWYWSSVRFFTELPTPELIGKEAAQRALRKVGQHKVESGKYDIVVENRVTSRLLGMFVVPLRASAIQQKQSFLEDQLGEKIASEKLTMIDDPFVIEGLGSRLYDGDGIAARKKVVIDKGVLKHFYIDNYYGKKLGMEPNCSSTTNIMLELGDKSAQEMIKSMDKGIFVTGFIGGNSNSTTGDFSFGLVGLLVENGEFITPVNELNISGNAKEFWNTIVQVGNDPYKYSSWMLPSVYFAQADISGK